MESGVGSPVIYGDSVRKLLAGLVLALSVCLSSATPCSSQPVGPFPGQTAPDVAARLKDGATLADLQRTASTIVLHFWGVT